MEKTVSVNIDGKEIILETGKLAKQASGAVVVKLGDTITLTTACASAEPRAGLDFFPLTVEYRERMCAGGKIPGGFFKREGKPTEKEVLGCRIIDRPIRPLFPDGFRNDVQIFATVLSAEPQIDPDVHCITGASLALCISNIPFKEPVAGIRVARVDGELVAFPTVDELEKSDLETVVAGSETSIMMVEGGSLEVSEEDLIGAIEFAHERIKKIIGAQKEIIAAVGKEKMAVAEVVHDDAIYEKVKELVTEDVIRSMDIKPKQERSSFLRKTKEAAAEKILAGIEDEKELAVKEKEISYSFEKVLKKESRALILEKNIRIGGRKTDEIRQIDCETGLLPRTHGSALFTRGETQALVTTTLGTKLDEQRIESYHGEEKKNYMLHYNFPPFSTGETRMVRSVSRREIGHGNLAERALSAVLPTADSFPYTIRIVSDIMESNGSSSMASVCGGSMSLMNAGVPIKSGVAGIAMGLIKEGEKIAILSDILGDEDHFGDMDFKITGTRDGITAFQMDIKIAGITSDIMRDALKQANKGRIHILDIMNKTQDKASEKLSDYAPRILTVKIPVDKIGLLIGPGGKQIRAIQDDTGATLNIDDDGTVLIYSTEGEGGDAAMNIIKSLTADAEVGKIYTGTVKGIKDFGAFVEFMPGKEGLLHISEIDFKRINNVEDVLKMGDTVEVKLLSEESGKYRLSRKATLSKE